MLGDQLTSSRKGSLPAVPSSAINIPGPLPNPPFVFPARDIAPSSAPASFSRTTARRPMSAIELSFEPSRTPGTTVVEKKRQVPPPLPSFSFNPSSSLDPASASLLSPPLSPQSPRAIPTKPGGGHRRSTSEFVGGNGKAGPGTELMSTSPKGADEVPASVSGPPAMGPPAGRRGHAHRRSAALSSHDLSMILKPTTPPLPKGGSAPSSPSDKIHLQNPFPNTTNAPFPSGKAANRVRVGFSDTLEFIPRPLSLVSSDTSSTMTMQRGHSVSNSISSIVSGAASPMTKEQPATAATLSVQKDTDGRPKTAGSILDGFKDAPKFPIDTSNQRRRGSVPLLSELSLSTPGTPSTPKFGSKKWSFFSHDQTGGDASPSRSRPVSAASSVHESQNAKVDIVPPSINVQSPDDTMPYLELTLSRRSTASKKHHKKQKKVKSWAGSILSRRTHPRSKKQKAARRSPTPPMKTLASMTETYMAASESLVVPETTAESTPSTTPEIQTDFTTWKPRRVSPSDDESMSPIIDLDAALGPFQTPSAFNSSYDPQFEASQRTGTSKRRMHSAAGMGGFIGPGMHYHRRAESAPEMVPFDYPRFGIHRLGSSSTMADVFEEDEEDEWEDTKASDKASDKDFETKTDAEEETGLGIDINVVEAEDAQSEKELELPEKEEIVPPKEIKRKGSALSEASSRQSNYEIRPVPSNSSLKDGQVHEDISAPVEIVDDSLMPRPHSRAPSMSSTATPPFRPRVMKEISPVEVQSLSLQPPSLTPASPFSTTQSSFPSPRSPFSYDTQRVSTATSSLHDENAFQMLLLGEPGPELRMSVDDVPSLSSSRSTMTKESGMYPGAYNPQFREGQRSASFSAAISRKRSSMASLSRLISSSHGEKSKLSIESRPESYIEGGERKEKTSKTKRISRLMQFWKPKDTPTS
ncbi:hypothetical protein F5884DRAFT_664183 [Xylogone sp. PMI_703]|nr:hypothetical protein F5884DRAFT_664183 [Xylogone sp. PMI_703]